MRVATARATNKSKVETWRRLRLAASRPRAPARLRRVAGGGVFIKRTLTDDYLWRLRFLQDLSGGLSGLTLNALTGRLNEVDKSIRYAANSGHVFRFSRTIWISASVSASVRRGRDLQSSLMVPW